VSSSPEDAVMAIGSFRRASCLSVKALRLLEQHRLLEPYSSSACDR